MRALQLSHTNKCFVHRQETWGRNYFLCLLTKEKDAAIHPSLHYQNGILLIPALWYVNTTSPGSKLPSFLKLFKAQRNHQVHWPFSSVLIKTNISACISYPLLHSGILLWRFCILSYGYSLLSSYGISTII